MIETVQQQMERCLAILEVDASHSWEDIEKQYRLLIQRWHPDRNSGKDVELAESKFIEINTAYKALREQYRKNGAIPRSMPPEQKGPLLGTKKEVIVKPPLFKNKIVLSAVLGIALLSVFGAILWSLDARLAKNNRDRATIQKTTNALKAEASSTNEEAGKSNTIIKQSASEQEQ